MYFAFRTLAVALLLLASAAGNCFGQANLRIIGWNMEGNGDDIDPPHLVKQLGIKQGVDIWGLSEVRPSLFDDFLGGAKIGEQADYDIIKGTTGQQIRLAIIYNKKKLKLIKSDELISLFELSPNSGLRAPLIAQFEGETTKQKFIFMVNHLASGNAQDNKKQSELLVKWVKTQTLPVIATGDYNFFDNRPGLGIMRQTFFELEPVQPVPTFSEPLNGRIDFIFLGNRDKAVGWTGMAEVLNREDDKAAVGTFKDNSKDTDHRPIGARFTMSDVSGMDPPVEDDPEPLLQQLLERIERLEERIKKLENK